LEKKIEQELVRKSGEMMQGNQLEMTGFGGSGAGEMAFQYNNNASNHVTENKMIVIDEVNIDTRKD
jgi:hypothetical protein